MGTVGRMDEPGCSHSAVIHSGAEDLVRRLVPHFQLAHSQAAAVLVCVDAAIEARVRAEMGSMCDGFEFRSADARYSAPGQAMTALHSFVADAGARGAPSFWSIGAIPLEHDGRDHRWVRYEAAVSTIFAGLALRAVCLYDSVRTPVSLWEGIERAHDRCDGVWTSDGTTRFDHHLAMDEVPFREPDLFMRDPEPRDVRTAVQRAVADTVSENYLADLLLVCSEVASNAVVHGTRPVEVALWREPAGCFVQVCDSGTQPIDPIADLRPRAGGAHGGFGLWTVGQLGDILEIATTPSGHAVTIFVPTRA